MRTAHRVLGLALLAAVGFAPAARAPRPPYDREAVNAAAWLRTHPAPKG
jgi:hypothetical protein